VGPVELMGRTFRTRWVDCQRRFRVGRIGQVENTGRVNNADQVENAEWVEEKLIGS
jgi:uncharacterized protein (DUF2126 family)